MEQSDTIGQLAEALSAFQGEVSDPSTDQLAKIPGKDGKQGYVYTYANLAGYLKMARPLLAKNGLAFTQGVSSVQGGVTVTSMLMHKSGEWLRESFSMQASGSPQQIGGIITYARRYSAAPLLGIATEDDDAAAATHGMAPQGSRDSWTRDRDPQPARTPQARAEAPGQSAAPSDPGAYIFPIGKDKGYQGKPIREVPEGYLRNFIMGDKFDKEDIKEATQRFLDTLETKENTLFLEWAVGHVGGNAEKFKEALDRERESYFGKVRLAWFDAAWDSLMGKFTEEQLEAVREDYRAAERLTRGEVEPEQVPDPGEPEPGNLSIDDIPFG
jgi:hypothetical protein